MAGSALVKAWVKSLSNIRGPEWVVGLYLFLFHFVWEMLQTPFFAEMATMAHWPATLMCLKATVGDVFIGLVAFAAASLVARDRGWFIRPRADALLAYVSVGVMATVGLEMIAIRHQRWSYSGLMPVLPWVEVGVVPILQWLVLPWPVLALLRRHHRSVRSDVGR